MNSDIGYDDNCVYLPHPTKGSADRLELTMQDHIGEVASPNGRQRPEPLRLRIRDFIARVLTEYGVIREGSQR